MYCLVREVFSGVEGVTMTHHTWFLDEGRNAGVGRMRRGSESCGQIVGIPFIVLLLLFFQIFFIYFFPSAEKFTSTHETLIVGSKYIVVFHSRLPPDDFKVKARIHHGEASTELSSANATAGPRWRHKFGWPARSD